MFEARIRKDMEVADAEGRPVGTVDEVAGDVIGVMQGDAPSLHFQVPLSAVERVEGNRLWLKADTFLPKSTPSEALHSHDHSRRSGNPLFGTSGHGTGMGGSGVGH
ncbi:MAG TPA: DUF2171 domain-containing protein [Sphingobium sp.]|nr:DUF2171 domain-containing protein [Sphingobium sp.]